MRGPLAVALPLVLVFGTALLPGGDDPVPRPVECVDDAGVWLIPDGLVLGGPLANDRQEPFRTWLDECGFGVLTFTQTVFTPFEEAHAMWAACSSSSEDHHAADECGPEPTRDQALPDGTIPAEVAMVHKGTPHGSVQYSQYIYTSASTSNPADPVNVFYYGNGDPTLVASKLQFHSAWRSTNNGHHPGATCSSDKFVRIDDAAHGGSNAWHGQRNMQEKDWVYSHATSSCSEQRYHSRFFGPGPTDNHVPSFGRYLPAAYHSEDWGHDVVSPYDGRVRAQSDTSGKPWVQSTSLLYVGNFNCGTCGSHDGYELNVRVL